ncbi:MAG TPA: hypothetical protein VK508_19165 [Cyclobacteriaceae bacterium]|nr:hypothetical protein [Cyclobacteriaceae bacterium]
MTLKDFKQSLGTSTPPPNLPVELEALWHDAKGDWNRSHDVIQDVNSKNAAWIHAYLHRKEGDLGNAQYWYARAGHSMPPVSLEDEWASLVEYFLKP